MPKGGKQTSSTKFTRPAAVIKKTTRAKYRDASGALHSEGELFERCADSARMNAPDTGAMIPWMLQPAGIHSQRERMVF
jgi:hypothetical protein